MDEYRSHSSYRFTALAISFELALGLCAVVLGWLIGPWPWEPVSNPRPAGLASQVIAGVLTAFLLFAAIVWADQKPIWLFRDLQQTVRRLVAPLFRGVGLPGLLLISLSAGLGEELLFRGYCQAGLTRWFSGPGSVWFALIGASLIFGACHWVSAAYAVVATAMGMLLGGLFLATGDLVAPVVAHSLYDFLALLYLTRPDPGFPVKQL